MEQNRDSPSKTCKLPVRPIFFLPFAQPQKPLTSLRKNGMKYLRRHRNYCGNTLFQYQGKQVI